MKRTIGLQPPPFAIYDGLLDAADHDALFQTVVDRRQEFEPSTVYRGSSPSVVPEHRVSTRISFPMGAVFDLLIARVSAATPDIFTQLGMRPFPIRTIENEIVAHGDGAHFSRHLDTVVHSARHRSDGDRLISCVYYFGKVPQQFSGGDLRLFKFMRDDDYIAVTPQPNRLVVFPSFVHHEVTRVACPSGIFEDSRFAINIWLRR